jgi:hypothetical protein
MKVKGVKATGFSRGQSRQAPEIEMHSGCECVTRRGSGLEYTVSLSGNLGSIRLTLDEAEVRDWHMRLSRALAALEPR